MPIRDQPRVTQPRPLDVMSRYLSVMRSGDYDVGLRFYAEDAVIHVPGHSRHAGTHRGREAVGRYFESAIAAAPEGGVQIELVDMLASHTRVALVLNERFHVDGGVVEIQRVNVYRVRDGEIAEAWLFEANQYEIDALLATGKAGGS